MTINQSTTDNPHYVTPEEADLKFCPVNHGMITYCDGPKCMAWRWGKLKEPEYRVENNIMGPHEYSTTHGYCGMVQS
jgi:hypothetical protein